jgi:hypothetical protein
MNQEDKIDKKIMDIVPIVLESTDEAETKHGIR